MMPFDATYVLYVKIDVPLDKLLIIPENIHVTPSVGGFMVWNLKFRFCRILSLKLCLLKRHSLSLEFIFTYTFLGVGMIKFRIFSGTIHIYWAK